MSRTVTIASANHEQALNVVIKTILLIVWSMLFATLFLCYFILRTGMVNWPPLERLDISLGLPFFSLFMIILSSFFLELANKQHTKIDVFKLYWKLAICTGIAFFVSQVFFLKGLKEQGILAGTSIFSSMVYAFSWIHGAHLLIGFLPLFFWYRKKLGTQKSTSMTSNLSLLFWHFLTAIWIMIFSLLFLL